MADNESINIGRRSTRGFASMDPAKRREIAKKGGHAAHQKGTAHEFTPEEARAAGRKGGERSRASHNGQKNLSTEHADNVNGGAVQNTEANETEMISAAPKEDTDRQA